MKAIKVYEWYLVVEGSGTFPFDMLRYDSAFPVEQEDAGKLEHEELRRIVVCRRGVNESPGEHRRWRSFGWVVVLWTQDKGEALNARNEPPGSLPTGGRS